MRNFITIIAISTLVAFACKKKVEEAPVTNSKLANNKIVYTYKAPSSVSESMVAIAPIRVCIPVLTTIPFP